MQKHVVYIVACIVGMKIPVAVAFADPWAYVFIRSTCMFVPVPHMLSRWVWVVGCWAARVFMGMLCADCARTVRGSHGAV